MANGILKVGEITTSSGSGNITIGSGVTVNVNRPSFFVHAASVQAVADSTDTKVNLDQFERAGVYLFLGRFLCPALTKFRPETEKDRFERMGEFYMSEYNKEWRTILEDGVEYDETGDGTIQVSEREPLHGFRRLTR